MTDSTAIILVPGDLGAATLGCWADAIVRADAAGWPMVMLAAADPADPVDGLAMAAFCASRTQRIGLCASIDPATFEPFTLARGLATLDHLSGGRAAWRLADGGARSAELADVVRKLLISWGADALVQDRENGLLSSADAVQATHHEGAFFKVRGPLNMPRPPQGVPPLLALPGDAAPGPVDMTVKETQLLRCSIDEVDAVLDGHVEGMGATLRARLGLAA